MAGRGRRGVRGLETGEGRQNWVDPEGLVLHCLALRAFGLGFWRVSPFPEAQL